MPKIIEANAIKVNRFYGMVPLKEKLPLNFGPDAGVGPTISPPTRNQSGSRSALRIHICRSPVNKGGPGAESHRKLPARPSNSTCGTKQGSLAFLYNGFRRTGQQVSLSAIEHLSITPEPASNAPPPSTRYVEIDRPGLWCDQSRPCPAPRPRLNISPSCN
jgi:hypothetical protein